MQSACEISILRFDLNTVKRYGGSTTFAAECILHSLYDNLSEHILEQEDDTLYALTPIGAFHVAQLRLNRLALIAYCLVERQLQLARQELLALRQRLAELHREEEEVRRQEEDLGRTLSR